jgi:carbon monoxide dehydrogenase subunit G
VLLQNNLTSAAAPDVCFAALLDLPFVGSCLPGALVEPAGPDGSFPVHLTVRLGPMRFDYAGIAAITTRDAAARSAQIRVEMKTSAAGERAQATSDVRVNARDGGSFIEIVTDVALQGRAASFGQGLIGDIARRLLDKAADCIESKLRAGSAAGTTLA